MWGKSLVVVTVLTGVAIAAPNALDPNSPPKQEGVAAAFQQTDKRFYLNAQEIREAKARFPAQGELKSLLNVKTRLAHGDFIWDDSGVPEGRVWIRVDPDNQLVSVFRAGHEIGTAVILFGAEDFETPTGAFPILAKIRDHYSRTYDNAPMPYTLRFTNDGVAIHGSDVRWGAATHGCVGVPLEFAKRVFNEAKMGDRVVVSPHRSETI